MKKNKKSGIILITTLLFMAIMTMMTLIIVQNGMSSLSGGKSYSDSEQAYLAALSGVELVKAELYENKHWGENTSVTSKLSNGQDIIIKRDNKYLTGYIKLNPETNLSETEYDSRFDIVFDDKHEDRCRFASINNLNNKASISKESGININGEKILFRRDIPGEAFYLVVKGKCGKRVKYIETVFTSDGPSVLDQGSNAFGNISIHQTKQNSILNEPALSILNKNSAKSGKLIAGRDFSLTGVTNDIGNLIYTKKPTIISSNEAQIGKRTKTSDREELESNNIIFDNNTPNKDEISTIDTIENAMKNAKISDSSFKSKISSGTYVFVRDKKSGTGEWQYFPQNIDNQDIDNFIKTNNPEEVKNKTGISFTSEVDKVIMKRDRRGKTKMEHVTVQEPTRRISITDNVSSDGPVTFMVADKYSVVDKDTNQTKTTYKNSNLSVDFSIGNGTLKTNGDLTIKGEVTGTGKILSNGNLTMNSGSVMETKPQSGVAIWANGDVNIKEAKNLSSDTDSSVTDKLLSKAYESAFKKGITTSDGSKIQIGKNTYTVNETIDDVDIDTTHGDSYSFFMEDNNKKLSEITIELKDSKVNVYKNENYLYTFTHGKIKGILSGSIDNNKSGVNTKIQIHRTGIHIGDYEVKINNKKVGILDRLAFNSYKDKYNPNNTIYDGNNMLFSTYDHKKKQFIDKKIATTQGTGKKTAWKSDLQDDEDDIDIEVTDTYLEDYLEAYIKNAIASTEVKGTVYSNGNININSSKHSFNILGALISKGNININNVSSSELKYDPDYVPFFQNYGIITNLVFQSVF